MGIEGQNSNVITARNAWIVLIFIELVSVVKISAFFAFPWIVLFVYSAYMMLLLDENKV